MENHCIETYKVMAKDYDCLFEKNFNINNEIYELSSKKNNHSSLLQKRILPPIPKETNETKCPTQILNPQDRIAKTASIWFQSKISRTEVEDILKGFEAGIFIIRMDSLFENMVLSYKFEDKVAHVKIKINPKEGFYVDGSLKVFKSINNLVYYYMQNPIREPNIKLKIPNILMESSHPNHLKFFENMKLDFWKTNVSQLKLSDVFLDTLIECNFQPINKKKVIYYSAISLPDLITKEKCQNSGSNRSGTIKNDEDSITFFQKLRSKFFKHPSTKLRQPPISHKKRIAPSTPPFPVDLNEINFFSGLANDFADYAYDYDE